MRSLLHIALLFVPAVLAAPFAEAQVCEGNYYLHTQAEVDAFNCVEVTGDLHVGAWVRSSDTDVSDLSGLSELTTVGGYLDIRNALTLHNLSGLDKLVTVGGDLNIIETGLTEIGGLHNLESVGGRFYIHKNGSLQDLNGFNALTTIGGYFLLEINPNLTDIDELSNLIEAGGSLGVAGNDALTNVDGLVGVASVGGNLGVSDNESLSECTTGLADLIQNDGVQGTVGFGHNAPGCNSVCEVTNNQAEGCTIEPVVCEGDRSIEDQYEADIFNCSVVTGNLRIGGHEPNHGNTLSQIQDLNGLSVLTEVGGDFSIVWNAPYIDVDSLHNLTLIGGDLFLFKSSFASVDGLAGGSQLGGNIRIQENNGPTNLDGLSGITEVNGYVSIGFNYDLSNVDGLANIESISGSLSLSQNSSLSECSVGLANLIESGGVGGGIFIGNNAPGCNSVEEILNGVDAEDEATPLVTGLAAPYPNPTVSAATLTYSLAEPDEVTLTLYDALGRRVRTLADGPRSAGEHEVTLDTELPAGTYVVRFEAGGETWTERVTVVR